LPSLLWWLRRATKTETGLFEIQAKHLNEFRHTRQVHRDHGKLVYALFGSACQIDADRDQGSASTMPKSESKPADPTADLARCFLRFANLPSYPLDRRSRDEAKLWHQAGKMAIEALEPRKPQDRGRPGR
jgi:hypothetical protein